MVYKKIDSTLQGNVVAAVDAAIDATDADLAVVAPAFPCNRPNVEVVNDYAIEHLQVMIDEPRSVMDDLYNYGSLFLGDYSPVVFGDKAVGTNHSLPTLEVARYSGEITVDTYLKILTHQEATEAGGARIAPWAAKICELEGTHAHQLSAEARLRDDISRDYGPEERVRRPADRRRESDDHTVADGFGSHIWAKGSD